MCYCIFFCCYVLLLLRELVWHVLKLWKQQRNAWKEAENGYWFKCNRLPDMVTHTKTCVMGWVFGWSKQVIGYLVSRNQLHTRKCVFLGYWKWWKGKCNRLPMMLVTSFQLDDQYFYCYWKYEKASVIGYLILGNRLPKRKLDFFWLLEWHARQVWRVTWFLVTGY